MVFGSGTTVEIYKPAEPGVSLSPASSGELGNNTGIRTGGTGGIGLSAVQARALLNPGVKAGGGGEPLLSSAVVA